MTFETQAGFLKCLDLLPNDWLSLKTQPKARRLNPKKALKVRKAPPPSTIQWENMQFTWGQRRARRFITFFLTLACLSLSVAATFSAERAREALQTDVFKVDCDYNTTLTALNITQDGLVDVFTSISENDPDSVDLLVTNSGLNKCFCSTLGYSAAATAALSREDKCHEYWIKKVWL